MLLWVAIGVFALLGLGAAFALWCLPKRLISDPGAVPEAFRNTLPPRHLLNRTGRALHDLFWVSAALMVLLVVWASLASSGS
jgi:hypothetical protein